ncbi:MAG: triosephosphate isomerase [Candidatus Jorgensenbacteria bacterium GW2011_GWA1_48_11]|uniref:Triosephosphate isomerase n=1 Tax=Candidatus Jorgensenbacteria bacterium GW2011_GWA1_48_11 TaxID=1618660 RepID=A0A0G1UAR0_9BACT|nr:MAG: triosephosphate isomerase [Candidatus Jorgensenbacteria bacterium GW2011_GWA1_48_11]KKW11887.1 MAG: triosephosphate isomerase [Candidatus Jorgensenbacteria bacterium GW2011_GWB1_49_9]
MAKLIIANWKMNPMTESEALKLAKASDFSNVVVTPPFIFMNALKKTLKKAKLGAQNGFFEKRGPYTGEVSFSQLKAFGVRSIIIGHSESRALGETDDIINKKTGVSLREKFRTILCVGEPWIVRKKGFAAAENFVKKQLFTDLKGIQGLSNLVVAYEPIWAIGTGKNDDPEKTVRMAISIKEFLRSKFKIRNPKLLYGGSVKAKNIQGFIREKTIDGVLVGGASLKPAEFIKIVKITAKY